MKKKRVRPYDIEAEVSRFNEQYPPGTCVVLVDDLGEQHKTKTRSIAWIVGNHPVVLVYGRVGGYLLSRIRPV